MKRSPAEAILEAKIPVLRRERLYTGPTRARKSVELWFEKKVFRAVLLRRVSRTSGLRDALAGA